MPDWASLIEIIEEAETLMKMHPGDYTWSSWIDDEQAFGELDGILARLRDGEVPVSQVSVIFAATGPMQELALQSGWGDEFIALAGRLDTALAQ